MFHTLSITSDEQSDMINALNFFNLPKIKGFKIIKNTLLLYHKDSKNLQKFPYPINNSSSMALFIQGWLSSIQYPKEPDCDGSINRGFELFLTTNGGYLEIVDSLCEPDDYTDEISGWSISVAIKPFWIVYDK